MFCEKTYHQNVKNSLFQNVTNLTEVTIPASVTKLDTATFYQSSNLERVYYLGMEEIEYKSNTMQEASNFTVNAWNFYTDVVTANTTLYAKWDIVKTEITKYSPDSKRVYFTCGKSDVNAIVIFVDYANYDDPTFISQKYVPVTTQKTQGENTVSVTVSSGISLFAGDKIMIWENFETLKPLCEAYRVSGRETDIEDDNPGIDLPIDKN